METTKPGKKSSKKEAGGSRVVQRKQRFIVQAVERK